MCVCVSAKYIDALVCVCVFVWVLMFSLSLRHQTWPQEIFFGLREKKVVFLHSRCEFSVSLTHGSGEIRD